MLRVNLYIKSPLFTLTLLFCFILYTLFPCSLSLATTRTPEEAIAWRQSIPIESNLIENWPTGPIVSARSAILMDAATGTILYEKNIHEILYPASTTKIMTALLALENSDLNEIVTFSYDAVFSVPSDGSNIAIDRGEKLSVEECLQAILIASANEVSNGLAEHVSGSMEDFANAMTERAKELGCLNTNFANANGLHDDNHYTTAYDLALIGQAFVTNEVLCKFATSTYLHFLPTDNQPDEIIARSSNRLLSGGTYEYDGVIASKTGYTSIAQSTLFTAAEKNNMRLICVVLEDTSPTQFEDTIALLDYGFQNFESVIVSQHESKYNIGLNSLYDTNIPIFGNSGPGFSLDQSDSLILPKTITFDELSSSLNYDTTEPDTLAELDYYYLNTYIGSASIIMDSFTSNTYEFEDTDFSTLDADSPIIFINILGIIATIVGLAIVFMVILNIQNFLRNYNFNSSRRKNWKKRRRKYRTTSTRRNAYQRRNRRRRRHTNQSFSDYDS